MNQCKAKTKSGTRCKNTPQEGSDYCHIKSHRHPKTGNKFALGNSGRSKRWESPEELQSDIDAYFDWCDKHPLKVHHTSQIDKNTGKPIQYEIDRPYTIEGLSSFLECDRLTLINYEKEKGYEAYHATIRAAKNKVQQNKIERGLTGIAPAAVTIFDLKNNHAYKDRTEVHNLNETTHEFLNDLFPEIREDEH